MIEKFFQKLGRLKYVLIVLSGVLTGLGIFTFYQARAWSYLSDDPKTCINCHVMTSEYVSWKHSSHGRFSTCNDCHLPHQNPVKSYVFKSIDGVKHSVVFTLHAEPQAIVISKMGRDAVQENCKRCHEDLIHDIHMLGKHSEDYDKGEKLCWDCHRHVPHGTVKSLSSVPNAGIGIGDANRVPQWIKESITTHNKGEKSGK